MLAKTRFTAAISAISLLFVATSACASVNKSVRIDDGEQSSGASSVNGKITVGDSAVVTGSLTTVNGGIRIGSYSQVEDASTVNGSLKLGAQVTGRDMTSVNGSISMKAGAKIDGEVSVVNGGISVDEGSSVSGEISNVNGDIEITGSDVGGDITTVTGDVMLENATLKADLVIKEPKGNYSMKRKPRIVIGPGSSVAGEIRIEHDVDLYISDTADVGSVSGVMSMDDAVRFSGSRP